MLLRLSILIALGAASAVQAATAEQTVADLDGLYKQAKQVLKDTKQARFESMSERFNYNPREALLDFTSALGQLTAEMSNEYNKLQGQTASFTPAEQTEVCDANSKFYNEVQAYLKMIDADFHIYQKYGNNPNANLNPEQALDRQRFDFNNLETAIINLTPDCLATATAGKEETDGWYDAIAQRYENGV